jgi:hypothetical protein
MARIVSSPRPPAAVTSGPLIRVPPGGSAAAGVWLAVAAGSPAWVGAVGAEIEGVLFGATVGLGSGIKEVGPGLGGDATVAIAVAVAVAVAVTVTVGAGLGVAVGLGSRGSTTVAVAVAGPASCAVATSVKLKMAPGLKRRIVTRIRIQTVCPKRSRLTSHTARLGAGQWVNLAAALRRV